MALAKMLVASLALLLVASMSSAQGYMGVDDIPTFVGNPPTERVINDFGEVHLLCLFKSSSQPRVYWYKVTEPVTSLPPRMDLENWRFDYVFPGEVKQISHEGIFMSRLKLHVMSTDDSGNFICAVENRKGISYHTVKLEVDPKC